MFILARPLTQSLHMGSLLIHRLARYQLDSGSAMKKWLDHGAQRVAIRGQSPADDRLLVASFMDQYQVHGV